MAELCAEAKQAAQTELPVLIQGETGTGKELLARAIHFNSKRMNSPMHVQNCGGMSDDTLHSELFGHLRGAFTGAVADRLGLFRAADGGTVFLDEISEISPSFQVSLLRFLQEGEVKPLGSDRIYHADVRVIAASNRPLDQLVERGEFRRDLYYRLKGFELHIPALRERPEDIPALTQFFIEKYAGVVGRRVVGVTKDALAKLEAYDYPGNVRELETEIRRMVAIAEQGGYIAARHLSPVFDRVAVRRDDQPVRPSRRWRQPEGRWSRSLEKHASPPRCSATTGTRAGGRRAGAVPRRPGQQDQALRSAERLRPGQTRGWVRRGAAGERG